MLPVPSIAAVWLRPPKLRLKELCLLAYDAGRLGSRGRRNAGRLQGCGSSKTKATSNHFLWKMARSSRAEADSPAVRGGWELRPAENIRDHDYTPPL